VSTVSKGSDQRDDFGESLLVFRNSSGVECRGTLMSVTQQMAVFEVYNPYSIVQLSEVLNELRISRGDRTVYAGKAVVSNLVNTGLMLIVSATLVDDWSSKRTLKLSDEIVSEVSVFVNDWEQTQGRLLPSYLSIVNRFRNFLEELSRWLGQGEALAGISDPATPDSAKRNFVHDVMNGVGGKIWELMKGFEAAAQDVAPDAVNIHKSYARREIHPLILCSPFLHRTFTKPLGYAGDYEMVNMILTDPIKGPNTYARILNLLNLNGAAATAHRNRIAMLVAYLRQSASAASARGQKLRVLNIACGPAAEIQQFAKDPLVASCEFTLLDFNAETLKYATAMIEGVARDAKTTVSITTILKSIHDLLKETSSRFDSQRALPSYDLVYCAGLFDYLSDKICQRLVRLFTHMTRPGGMVLVTNVHSDNPNRLYMEHLLEWHLYHRNDAQMLSLAPGDVPARTVRDQTGVNIFLEITKPGSA